MQKGMFVKDKLLLLFKHMSQLLVLRWINTTIMYFKLNIKNIKINIYGLPLFGKKLFYKGILIPCLILHSLAELLYNDLYRYNNTTSFKFLKSTLLRVNIFPLIGDIILWNNLYWLIGRVVNLQLIAGDYLTPWTYTCLTSVQSDSKIKLLINFTNLSYRYQKEE